MRREHLDDADEVGSLAAEALVLGDRHSHVEVAGAPARPRRRARRPRSGSAGRTRSRPGSRRPRCACRRPGRARRTPRTASPATRPSPSQRGQAPARTSWPNGGPAHAAGSGRAAALVAGPDRGPGLGAVATAALARRHRLEAQLARRPGDHLLERDLDLGADVAASRRAASAGSRTAPRTAGRRGRRRPRRCPRTRRPRRSRRPAAGAQALVPEGVVDAPALGVGEHLVGLGGLLEASPRPRGRVVLTSGWSSRASLRKAFLISARRRAAVHAEDLVVVARHADYLS